LNVVQEVEPKQVEPVLLEVVLEEEEKQNNELEEDSKVQEIPSDVGQEKKDGSEAKEEKVVIEGGERRKTRK
jgi:hypothetical protein